MTTTATAPPARPHQPSPQSGYGLLGVLAGTDHKRVAVRLGLVAFVFFAAGGILALIMRANLAAPDSQVVSADTYNQLFTMHGSTMIYLFLTPMAFALGLYLIPLQVGASEVAAPRAALTSLWLVLGGGLTMWSGFLTNNGAGKSGWTAFDPLSDRPYSTGIGMDFWIFGVILASLGALLLAGCILATIVTKRAPGMTMLRLPVFTWTMIATCLMTLVTFPVLITAMGLLWVQREWGGVFTGAGGALAYQHLFWFYGHPVVYVMFFPFVGAVGEVVAVFSRRRFFGYRPFTLSILAFAALSTSVWAHHMFTTDQIANRYFSLTSTSLAVPAGIEYFDLIATMIGGAILLRTPMLFALAFILQFLIGGLSGVFIGSPALNYHVSDSYFIVAHFHYTLFAGSLFGFFAGVYYWWPKWTGFTLREGLGRLHFVLLVIGTNLTFFPMFILGYDGMARRIASYPASSGWQPLNIVATTGAGVIALAMLAFAANVVVSARRRVPAGADPWEGHTLEWVTTSPPPRHNFAALPPIRSHAPLLDLRTGENLPARAEAPA